MAQLAAARQGTHSVKTRSEVSGGGAKPYRQKGTGRARQGSIRAPQYAGGGIVHGPTPRGYAQRTPKKMIAAALRGALSDRARDGRVHVVADLTIGDVPSTKTALSLVAKALGGDKITTKTLVVLHRDEDLAWISLRNAAALHVITVDQLNAYDVLVNDDVVFTASALSAYVAGPTRASPRRPSPPSPRPDRGCCLVRERWGGAAMSNALKIRDHRDILLAPVVSEKSYSLLDENKYTFLVATDANKTEIKIAVESIFKVKVTGVNTHQPAGQEAADPGGLGQASRHQAGHRERGRRRAHRHLLRTGRLTGIRTQ